MKFRCSIDFGTKVSEWDFTGQSFTIGREASTLILDKDGCDVVSGMHARIEQTPSGSLLLTDLQSRNGTFLNGQRIEAPSNLKVGDVIRFGKEGPILNVDELDGSFGEPAKQFTSVSRGAPPVPNGQNEDLGAKVDRWGTRLQGDAASASPTFTRPQPPSGPIVSPEVSSGPIFTSGAASEDVEPSETRMVVDRMQQSQKKGWLIASIVGGVALLLIAGIVGFMVFFPREPSGDQVFEELIPSCVFIVHEIEVEKSVPVTVNGKRKTLKKMVSSGLVSSGSGVLLDLKEKLVMTNYHVVSHNGKVALEVKVYFPQFTDDGQLKNERFVYAKHVEGIRAKVVAHDEKSDLAVLRLDSLPKYARAVPLASQPAKPGEALHMIGNPGAADPGGKVGVLWGISSGEVRSRSHLQKVIGLDQQINAWILLTNLATNPGDSGGPVVNKRCEVVGINSHHGTGARLMTGVIDLDEIRRVLRTAGSRVE